MSLSTDLVYYLFLGTSVPIAAISFPEKRVLVHDFSSGCESNSFYLFLSMLLLW